MVHYKYTPGARSAHVAQTKNGKNLSPLIAMMRAIKEAGARGAKLSIRDVGVGMFLADDMRRTTAGLFQAFTGLGRLMELSRSSKATVRAAIGSLIQAGIIEKYSRSRREGGVTRKTTDLYVFDPAKLKGQNLALTPQECKGQNLTLTPAPKAECKGQNLTGPRGSESDPLIRLVEPYKGTCPEAPLPGQSLTFGLEDEVGVEAGTPRGRSSTIPAGGAPKAEHKRGGTALPPGAPKAEHGFAPAPADVVTGAEAAAILGEAAGRFAPWLTGPKGAETLTALCAKHGSETVRGILHGYVSCDPERPGGWSGAHGLTIHRLLTGGRAFFVEAAKWRKFNSGPKPIPPPTRTYIEEMRERLA